MGGKDVENVRRRFSKISLYKILFHFFCGAIVLFDDHMGALPVDRSENTKKSNIGGVLIWIF